MTENGRMLVTCLCLTRNRRQWLPRAVSSFLAQTYEARELLVVADGQDVSDLVPADPRIHLTRIPETAAMTIGRKRNLGCGCAAGTLICHWDDDDWSAPGRLADQVGRLLETRCAVTGYDRMRFTDGRRWWLYDNGVPFVFGTSLCYRKDWWTAHPFENKQVGEDTAFVQTARDAGELGGVCAAGDLMYATIHPDNTSPRGVPQGDCWKAIEACV